MEDLPKPDAAAEVSDSHDADASETRPERRKRKRSRPLELIETIFVAFLLAIMIRATLAEARFIPSGSMIPSLLIGDRLIVEKVSYYFSDPKRGDIVVFYPPDPYKPLTPFIRFKRWLGFTTDAAYIKRVVGLPGETLSIQAGKVLIDGKPLPEPYIKGAGSISDGGGFEGMALQDDFEPHKIPDHTFFMMGDNRNNSRDSRVWGTLPRENVIGRTFLRFWPMQRLGAP